MLSLQNANTELCLKVPLSLNKPNSTLNNQIQVRQVSIKLLIMPVAVAE